MRFATLPLAVFLWLVSSGALFAQDVGPPKPNAKPRVQNATPAGPTEEEKAAAGTAGLVGLVCVGLVALLLYFLPSFIAVMRGHPNAVPVILVNLLLGWSFIGWVAALVWSFTAIEPRYGRRYD